MNKYLLAIDIGDTWIKAVTAPVETFEVFAKEQISLSALMNRIEKVPSLLSEPADFLNVIKTLIRKCEIQYGAITGIGVSIAGLVNYHGTRVESTTSKLSILKRVDVKGGLEMEFGCPVVLINDTDAASIAIAELGYLKGEQTIGVLCIGTNLGFSIWKNGRRWRPNGNSPLLGGIYTPDGTYNELGSVSKLESLHESGNLATVFSDSAYETEVKAYWQRLAGIITSAAEIYALDKVCISGELSESVAIANCDIKKELLSQIGLQSGENQGLLNIEVIEEANLELFGALSLIAYERKAATEVIKPRYEQYTTELPYQPNAQLNELEAIEVVQLLNKAEEEATRLIDQEIEQIAYVAHKVSDSLKNGGRLIYVGAGSSGRIAALDAVEIPCTYGAGKDQVIAVIAGGVSEAAIDIESGFEEDASSMPELLLLNITPKDVVIGISASGSAYYVLSGLHFAHQRKAYTVMLQQELPPLHPDYCHQIIPLHSGAEVVAGSTRMKAGTATKKILNFISTTGMICNGKVHGSFMTDLKCLNNKLVLRAQAILKNLYQLSDEESRQLLQHYDYNLGEACRQMNGVRNARY
ncbi:N-acetylmuramic acid 6-phosphate etherase [Solitalea koreensis]|uniref:N-acetylmuramic acid 6-phosphate etherase n=1 Tax=Solitalea koreensis TaxID=543615 RepID=A0A521DK13_9SPHI|nr:N-acetylmuramic acid 6-phosphate etherase [Solitalea koreensis]SMO72036.1 N-acetylmuramic acid 6-phosphate etherase [Solitalea koreensis]